MKYSRGEGQRARAGVWAICVLALSVTAAASGWAVYAVTQPIKDPSTAQTYTYATVEPGEVGSSIALNTIAKWAPQPVGINQAVGLVTEVAIEPGAEVAAGDTLYSVNLRPTIVAEGRIPAFRPLSQDMEGADVAQLQSMLGELGFYGGIADGIARGGTDRAIKAWQKASGVAETGVVELGDVTFLPELPARVLLDSELIAPGKQIAGGELVVQALAASPEFTIPASPPQAAMMLPGTRVSITGPEGEEWSALTAEQQRDPETQNMIISVVPADGTNFCGACLSIPVIGESALPSRIETIETVAGLVVPSAALTSDAAGDLFLVDVEGKRIPVTVIAAAKGISVVEGAENGLRVRLPATLGAAS